MLWILWFTISLGSGTIGHFPVDGTYESAAACAADAKDYWIPLLEKQFPNDPRLTVYCEQHPSAKRRI